MALTLADRQKAEVKAATDLAELVREYGVAYHYPINFPVCERCGGTVKVVAALTAR